MASVTDICNLALLRFGEKRIMSLDDASKPARTCKTFYAQTRDEVLRSHRWNFATKREALTQLVATPLYQYSYAYQLPSDFIRAIEINQTDIWEQANHFEIEGNNRLLTDEDTVNLKFIYRETNSELFDVLFVEALSLKLASKLATNLTGEASVSQSYLQEYNQLTAPLARRIDAGENRPRLQLLPTDSRFVNSRYGASG